VASLLPSGLALARGAVGADVHPIVFVFGEHRRGEAVFGGLALRMGRDYHDFGLVVPFVHRTARPHLHLYIPRMWSSYLPAWWSGNFHYGFPKDLAPMTWDGATFAMRERDGTVLARADVRDAGAWGPAVAGGPGRLDDVRATMALPVLGCRPDGRWVRSWFGWDFAAATVRAGRVRVALAPSVAGEGPASSEALSDGAFHVHEMTWNMSWPAPAD
jgi:hypothetical protein